MRDCVDQAVGLVGDCGGEVGHAGEEAVRVRVRHAALVGHGAVRAGAAHRKLEHTHEAEVIPGLRGAERSAAEARAGTHRRIALRASSAEARVPHAGEQFTVTGVARSSARVGAAGRSIGGGEGELLERPARLRRGVASGIGILDLAQALGGVVRVLDVERCSGVNVVLGPPPQVQ